MTTQQKISITFKFFKNSLKILNVYFWGDNVYLRGVTFTLAETTVTLGKKKNEDLGLLKFLFYILLHLYSVLHVTLLSFCHISIASRAPWCCAYAYLPILSARREYLAVWLHWNEVSFFCVAGGGGSGN